MINRAEEIIEETAGLSPEAIVIIISVIVGVLFLIALAILLYIFVFSKIRHKNKIKDLGKRFSYSDGLLVGQDSQYIHRLEIISRTNLLYVDKYEIYSKRFKNLYENDDKYAESMLKQLNSLAANNQYRDIKVVIDNARSAIEQFETKVNQLDKELFDIIKVEEEARAFVLRLKEKYRVVKQGFYVTKNDIEMVANSFQKAFDKVDNVFTEIEAYIDGAEYDEAKALSLKLEKVIKALDDTLEEMPNICALIQTIIPNKITSLSDEYKKIERDGIPLFHLSFSSTVERWKSELRSMKKNAVELNIANAKKKCETIQYEIGEVNTKLYKEKESRSNFEESYSPLYREVVILEKSFLKLCALVPEIQKVYKISQNTLDNFESLRDQVNAMSASKRMIDGFMHSGTKQPYSLLMDQLETLRNDYQNAYSGVEEFRTFIESLKTICQDAHDMIYVYFYHAKQIEAKLRFINIPTVTESYYVQIKSVYEMLNDIDDSLKTMPIAVEEIRDEAERFKTFANSLFDEIEHKYTTQQLAESAVVYANRDRYQQNDVHQQLSHLEQSFYMGEFEKVYSQATNIYHRNHVEDNVDGK